MKISYLAAILKWYKYFRFFFFPLSLSLFCWNMAVIVYIYSVEIIKKFWWESGFLWGFHEVRGTFCSQWRNSYGLRVGKPASL